MVIRKEQNVHGSELAQLVLFRCVLFCIDAKITTCMTFFILATDMLIAL